MWWSYITPVFKSGNRSDPVQLSQYLCFQLPEETVLFYFKPRLLEYANSLNILHKSQIGLLPNNRTADHVLTLRTLIEKYTCYWSSRKSVCFVNFRKAFNSVWQDGIHYKILQINVGANFYTLIKSLYSNFISSLHKRLVVNRQDHFNTQQVFVKDVFWVPLYSLIYTLTPRSHFSVVRYQTLLFYQTEHIKLLISLICW